jgi:rubrerythrin
MSNEFNADDIFEMAEQIERNGAAFYREAATKTDDPATKEMMLEFATMEDGHEMTRSEIFEVKNE